MRSDLFASRYLFHLHTRFTDGMLTIQDYVEYARTEHIDHLIFLEHIRRSPSYDVEELAAEVQKCESTFGVEATLGFETKLLPDGSLDISDEHLALAAVVGVAEHSFPNSAALLQAAFVKAVDWLRVSYANKELVWVHPGLWFQKRGLVPSTQPAYRSMMDYAWNKGLFIERNLRYRLVPEAREESLASNRFVIGVDSHNYADLRKQQPAVTVP